MNIELKQTEINALTEIIEHAVHERILSDKTELTLRRLRDRLQSREPAQTMTMKIGKINWR